MPHGQIVVGPPGAGKTTYCAGLEQFFAATGRKTTIFNMDPANETVPYTAAVSIRSLVCAEAVSAEHKLGPNGSLLFAMEMLDRNFSWLQERLYAHRDSYLVLDFPGQVELYTHNNCVRRVVQRMAALGYRMTCVNLVDSFHCTDAANFIAALTMSLTVLIKLELPAVSVLSKIDLIEQYGELPFDLEFFTENSDISPLLAALNRDPRMRKFAKLNAALVELVEDFPWVGFHTLDVQDRQSVLMLTRAVDKANGYSLANLEIGKATYKAIVGKPERDPDFVAQVQERYVKRR